LKKIGFWIPLGLLLIILLISIACGNSIVPTVDPLEGTEWQLVFYRKTQVIKGTRITANFKNGEINGSAGCNSYFGRYQDEGQNLTIGEIGMTEMYCMEPEGLMDQESTYLKLLAEAQSYEITDGRLIIILSGQETLTFEPGK
jgi:heat shock protein HslJ